MLGATNKQELRKIDEKLHRFDIALINNEITTKAFILHLTKNAKHFSVRCSYTGRNKSSTLANLFRTGIICCIIIT